MITRGWRADVAAATTRGRCVWYVTAETRARRHGAICKRTGYLTLTVGNLLPSGPFCRQHGLKAQDRATAQSITTGQTVRLEEIA
jgi:hypothetical protein